GWGSRAGKARAERWLCCAGGFDRASACASAFEFEHGLEEEHSVFARKWSRRTTPILAGAVALLLIVAAFQFRGHTSLEIARVPFSDLMRDLDAGRVAAVVVDGDTLDFTRNDGKTARTTAPANFVTANTAFVPSLMAKGIRIEVRTASEPAAYSYGALVLGLVFVSLLGVTLYRVTTGRIPALESKTREANSE